MEIPKCCKCGQVYDVRYDKYFGVKNPAALFLRSLFNFRNGTCVRLELENQDACPKFSTKFVQENKKIGFVNVTSFEMQLKMVTLIGKCNCKHTF